jgi:hypothetical protein
VTVLAAFTLTVRVDVPGPLIVELTCDCGESWPVDTKQGYEISKIGHFALDHSYSCKWRRGATPI